MDIAWSRGGHCYLVWASEVDAGGTCRRHWRPAPSRRRPSGWRGSCPGGWPWAAPQRGVGSLSLNPYQAHTRTGSPGTGMDGPGERAKSAGRRSLAGAAAAPPWLRFW